MINRPTLKKQARKTLSVNFGFYLKLFLFTLIFFFISEGFNVTGTFTAATTWTQFDSANFFTGLVMFLFQLSAMFGVVDLLRRSTSLDQPFEKAMTIFQSGDLFIGTIIVELLCFLWVFLWSLLLVVPGIIKAIAYSQAAFIYRDKLNAGEKIGYSEAVTLSRQMMAGHKWEYFVMQLSFIGWWLLSAITAGLAGIWVLPYYYITMANYYVQLSQQK